MRSFLPLFASLLLAAMPLPVQSKTAPVKGAVQGTATIGKGVVRGAGQTGVGVARGTGTVVRSTARGVGCVVTLGTRCSPRALTSQVTGFPCEPEKPSARGAAVPPSIGNVGGYAFVPIMESEASH